MQITRRPSAAHERLATLTGGPSAAPPPRTAQEGWVPAEPLAEADDPAQHPSPPPGRGRHRAGDPAGRAAEVLVPSTLRGGRWGIGTRAAGGALLALAVVAGALALRAGAPQGATLVPARTTVATTAAPAAGGAAPSPTGGGAAGGTRAVASSPGGAAGAELVVHVVGQVTAPGLVRVAAGSRVADALTAAGGATPEADLSRVNLARPVVDGEQLVVPRPGEAVAAPPVAGGAAGGGGASGGGAGPVDLNRADLAALDALDGIGPVLAQRILDWRTEHGRFSSVDELGEVSGIGDKLLAELRAAVTV